MSLQYPLGQMMPAVAPPGTGTVVDKPELTGVAGYLVRIYTKGLFTIYQHWRDWVRVGLVPAICVAGLWSFKGGDGSPLRWFHIFIPFIKPMPDIDFAEMQL